jgi:hypothetical protein
MRGSAWVSYCGRYRYNLAREWDPAGGRVCFVMLNPSTADAEVDDPTIRRCIRFARDWGAGGLDVVNLSPVRSANPAAILTEWPNRVHIQTNRGELERLANLADILVLAWGAHKHAKLPSLSHGLRIPWDSAKVLGHNADGSPKHPLYVRADTPLEAW